MDEVLWSIGDVARATGLSSRALRHYHSLSLLKPSATRNGIRFYSENDLLRLQQILIYRELGFALSEIPNLIAGKLTDQIFETQQTKLKKQIERLQKMLDALELTKMRMRNGETLLIEESFDGFKNDPYAEEAQARWPKEYAESQRRVAKLSKQEQAAVMQQHTDLTVALAELFKAGVAVSDDRVQLQVANHFAWICNFWSPSREAYVNLGRMYVADERFKKNYDKYADGLAQFLCEAIEVSGLGD